MKRFITLVGSLAILGACSGTPSAQDSATGSKLTAAPKPGDAPAGTPVATSGPAVAEAPASAAAAADKSADQKTAASNPLKKVFGGGPEYRDVTLPAGTILPVDLETTVGSNISRVEQPVSGRLRRAVTFEGAEVLPAGTVVSGHVTNAQRAGKVKGRASVGLRFTQLDTPGAGTTRISTNTISRLAPATKKKDAVKILAPAAAGAVIGRIAGGKSGAGKGAVIGGGAGAGYVLATRGEDVQIAKGADLAVKLTAPVTIRVRLK